MNFKRVEYNLKYNQRWFILSNTTTCSLQVIGNVVETALNSLLTDN